MEIGVRIRQFQSRIIVFVTRIKDLRIWCCIMGSNWGYQTCWDLEECSFGFQVFMWSARLASNGTLAFLSSGCWQFELQGCEMWRKSIKFYGMEDHGRFKWGRIIRILGNWIQVEGCVRVSLLFLVWLRLWGSKHDPSIWFGKSRTQFRLMMIVVGVVYGR